MARYVITDGTRWIQYKNGKYVPTSCPTFADEFSQKQAKSICENQLNKALRKVFHPEKCSDDLQQTCGKPTPLGVGWMAHFKMMGMYP